MNLKKYMNDYLKNRPQYTGFIKLMKYKNGAIQNYYIVLDDKPADKYYTVLDTTTGAFNMIIRADLLEDLDDTDILYMEIEEEL